MATCLVTTRPSYFTAAYSVPVADAGYVSYNVGKFLGSIANNAPCLSRLRDPEWRRELRPGDLLRLSLS